MAKTHTFMLRVFQIINAKSYVSGPFPVLGLFTGFHRDVTIVFFLQKANIIHLGYSVVSKPVAHFGARGSTYEVVDCPTVSALKKNKW